VEQEMGRPVTVAEVEDPGLEVSTYWNGIRKSRPRGIVLSTYGRRHGPITRLVSPSDIGELIKPFVFLDHAEVPWTPEPFGSIHPHSGIATLTTVLKGGLAYEDTTGKHGQVHAGGLEWMKAGNGVWHDGGALKGESLRAYQLWLALPAALENAPPESQYIAPEAVQEVGPVRVILGRFGSARSPIRAPITAVLEYIVGERIDRIVHPNRIFDKCYGHRGKTLEVIGPGALGVIGPRGSCAANLTES